MVGTECSKFRFLANLFSFSTPRGVRVEWEVCCDLFPRLAPPFPDKLGCETGAAIAPCSGIVVDPAGFLMPELSRKHELEGAGPKAQPAKGELVAIPDLGIGLPWGACAGG